MPYSSPNPWCVRPALALIRGEATHWSERAGALLAVMLHAGALEQRPFHEVLTAVNRHDPDETRTALARQGADRALDLLEGIVATEGREQNGIWSTASGVLAGYRTDAALRSNRRNPARGRRAAEQPGNPIRLLRK